MKTFIKRILLEDLHEFAYFCLEKLGRYSSSSGPVSCIVLDSVSEVGLFYK